MINSCSAESMLLKKINRCHTFVLRRSRARINVLVFLVCLILFISVFLIPFEMDPADETKHRKTCPPQTHRKSKVLQERHVHILSSNHPIIIAYNTRGKQMIQQKVECLDVQLSDKSNTFKMCIYDPGKDLVVSKYIKMYGAWEKENVAEMMKALRLFPDLILLDLGSNIGAFTLPAAVVGAEVIAVDPLKENHQLLQKSLAENDLLCQVTLVHNAIYRRRGEMKLSLNPHNIGGSTVMEIPDFRRNKIHASDKVDAVCLDDLIPLVKGKNVFMKMDIEGSEEAAFECAHQFFKQVNVKVLLMEWIYYRHNERSTSKIKSFLESHNMVATWGIDRDWVIDLSSSDSWADNVFWMQR